MRKRKDSEIKVAPWGSQEQVEELMEILTRKPILKENLYKSHIKFKEDCVQQMQRHQITMKLQPKHFKPLGFNFQAKKHSVIPKPLPISTLREFKLKHGLTFFRTDSVKSSRKKHSERLLSPYPSFSRQQLNTEAAEVCRPYLYQFYYTDYTPLAKSNSTLKKSRCPTKSAFENRKTEESFDYNFIRRKTEPSQTMVLK